MSLNSAIQIGQSALTASQIGLQVSGNNLANSATPGYSRQRASFSPVGGASQGNISIGRGVLTDSVRRQIDSALQSRLYNGLSRESAAQHNADVFSTVEATIGELSDHDLSSELSSFFNTWSERANLTKSSASVVQQGDKLASFIRRQRDSLSQLREQIDGQIGAAVGQAEGLMQQVAGLNGQIAAAEVGGAEASSLRDQRDKAIADLSQLMDVDVVDRGREGVNILVASTPVVMGTRSMGLTSTRETQNGQTVVKIMTRDPASVIVPLSGQIGSMLSGRTRAVDDSIASLDKLSSQLIFEVNKLHSTGSNADGLTTTTGTLSIATGDRTRPMNDPANATFAGLPFAAVNGGFSITVKDVASGTSQTVRINVDLDGINNAGLPGTADDSTPETIRAAIAAVPGLAASFSSDGKLVVTAASGSSFSFSNDSSGALAVMGVNSYFSGKNGSDIGVRDDLVTNPSGLNVGRVNSGSLVENGTALAIKDLSSKALKTLNGRSITDSWRDTAQAIGVKSASATSDARAAADVRQSLENQRSAISGVSTDEESINLLSYQRQYQGAAKLISVADQMMQTLMNLI